MDTTQNERVVSLSFKFNQDHPPPGWNKGREPIETALNRLGNTMINDIPVTAVSAIHFKYRETVMNDRDLATRLGFVMNNHVENDRLYLKVTAPLGPDPKIIRSNDIKMSDGRPAPILQNVEITVLPPGGKLDIELILAQGTSRLNGAQFTVVTGFRFYKTKSADGAYIFEIELLKGFEDGSYIYKAASDVIEGRLNPAVITATDMEELAIDWAD